METLTPQLLPIVWAAIALAGLAAIVLTVGLTLLLGTTSHRNVALPLVWLGAAVFAAAVTAVAILLVHR